MPFKKLHTEIQEKLEELEITAPTTFQSKSIPVIKGGANVFCMASEGSGKTTTLILTTLQKLKCEAVGNSPRAIVLVENKERALEMYDVFLTFTRYKSLRVYAGYEQLHIDVQKSEIFEGIDILISTPANLKKLFLVNGINSTQLKIFSVDDAEFLVQKRSYTDVLSITNGIKKCQYVLYSEKMHPMLKRFESYFMEYAKIVST
jgi:superfamily II DNA/RNA helicase